MDQAAGVDRARTVLVTGAADGIGRATAEWFVARGHRVIGSWHEKEPRGPFPGIRWVQADMAEPDGPSELVADVVDREGGVDVLVANAAVTRDRLLGRMTDDDLTVPVTVDLVAPMRLVRAVHRHMVRSRWGRIVLVSSVGGFVGIPAQTAYGSAKTGLLGLARSAARELGGHGVTANVVAPGPVDTPLLGSYPSTVVEALLARCPLGRLGRPDEVAAVIGFLCSEEASATSGALVPVDGGFTAAGTG